jgi:predicted esterase
VFAKLLQNTRRIFEKKYNCTFEFITGHYKLKEKGFAWYKGDGDGRYRDNEEVMADYFFHIQNKKNVLLVGFSEGAMYAIDLALRYRLTDKNPIIGVVSIAPPFSRDMLPPDMKRSSHICDIPIVMVGSYADEHVAFYKSQKWLPYFTTSFLHTNEKGHKVHIPLEVRRDMMRILDYTNPGV